MEKPGDWLNLKKYGSLCQDLRVLYVKIPCFNAKDAEDCAEALRWRCKRFSIPLLRVNHCSLRECLIVRRMEMHGGWPQSEEYGSLCEDLRVLCVKIPVLTPWKNSRVGLTVMHRAFAACIACPGGYNQRV